MDLYFSNPNHPPAHKMMFAQELPKIAKIVCLMFVSWITPKHILYKCAMSFISSGWPGFDQKKAQNCLMDYLLFLEV